MLYSANMKNSEMDFGEWLERFLKDFDPNQRSKIQKSDEVLKAINERDRTKIETLASGIAYGTINTPKMRKRWKDHKQFKKKVKECEAFLKTI